MAKKNLKSITFPNLPDTYTVVGETTPDGGEIFNDYEKNNIDIMLGASGTCVMHSAGG